jgi:Carboxypeptidase regulatory-like domain
MGHWRLLHDLAHFQSPDEPTIASADGPCPWPDQQVRSTTTADWLRSRLVATARAGMATAIAWSAASIPAQQPGPAQSQRAAPTSLVGVVGDSLHGGPLVGAVIMVDANSRTAMTDSIGRFRIDSIPPGHYRVGIFHPIVDSLGTTLVSDPIDFSPGEPLLVSLSVPSGATIRRTLCGQSSSGPTDQGGDSTGSVLLGRVLDAETETPLAHVPVTLTWADTAADIVPARITPFHREATTDEAGRVRLCGLPISITGILQAASPFALALAVQRAIALDDHIVTMATLHLPHTDPATPAARSPVAVLTGTIQRPDGSPLSRATVSIAGTSFSAVTAPDGTFALRNLPAGTRTVVVRSAGFDLVQKIVELAAREPQQATITVSTSPRVLSPVVVAGQRLQTAYARVGFERRRRAGIGKFLTADDLAAGRATHFSEVLTQNLALPRDNASTSDSFGGNRQSACPLYVLDGHPLTPGSDADVDALYRIGQIAAVEMYTAGATPSEFRVPGLVSASPSIPRALDGGCPTVVLWTKAHLAALQDQ